MNRVLPIFLGVLFFIAAAPVPLDSALVLQRYTAALANLQTPKAMIFTYAISQAGPTNIEQRHRIYRSGVDVRDEVLEVNGLPLHRRVVRVSQRADVYAIDALAPRTDTYELLFLGTAVQGSHLDYVYSASPLGRNVSGFVVNRLTIDGRTFLPRTITFTSSSENVQGTGTIEFGPFGHYWMPLAVSVTAIVAGKPAQERIVFSDYSFPSALPRSTFF